MRREPGRILTTHGGNLPRPADLDELIGDGEPSRERLQERLPGAVAEVVAQQIDCGLDVINDGEYVKAANMAGYSGYIHARVTGWEVLDIDPAIGPKRAFVAARDQADFPGTYESGLWLTGSGGPVRPGFATPGAAPRLPTTERVCTGPIRYTGHDAIAADVAALTSAVEGKPVDGFIAALGPLSLGAGARNAHYADEQEYMFAVAEALREEYKAVTDAGLVLQIDEPEFATTWQFHPEWTVEELRRYLEFAVEVLNHAIAGLPSEQIRMHSCWGSGHRPHTQDIGLVHIADLLVKVNAGAYAIESGNVRHAHEWRVWQDVKLPEGKILAPGVVSHATDLVEHPELVAERLVNFASVVGAENLQAGTDCGIGSRVGHAEIAWAKLRSLAEGAAIAGKRLHPA
ncbi:MULTISPECIES: cobalamin-independent methionine synthase II family protein [Pseudonocardia]|uniref:2-hydroxypropyl-CoM lyase n=1 Tax=Pseudonocardia autotrophica TaxID=2074 RepID=A0A1Y2MKP4_PSEAH|nr:MULTISPECIES: cobalamin-independent methionine synthase II family protein [Pseudonocardia]OSY35732.1 2-hydroxypropyl-CoM lyase [Pseudonocardia autotrophica]TDN74576.1 5-methyltetrahydropteroyltriglutamate--homocysteine methyltransferase [Pseudonocardia autotrophica]